MAKLSAVEFALCVLSMFGRVIDENRMAVQVLLLAIKSYNASTRRLGKLAVKQAGYGGRSSLRALAGYLGKDYTIKQLRTEEDAQAVLHTILDPVIRSLTRQQLAKLREDMDEAMRLASSAPIEEVRERVVGFVVKAWEDGRREHWMEVWKKGMEAQTSETTSTSSQSEDSNNDHMDQPTSDVDLPTTCSTGDIAIVPVMSTLKRRARVYVNHRSRSLLSPLDVCLGRGSSSSSPTSSSSSGPDEWYKNDGLVWHSHGWRMLYPGTTLKQEPLPVDFKFPPPGMLSATSTVNPTVTNPVVDSQQALEMLDKFKQWEDEWEKEQLGTWKAAINMDSALQWIVECTRNFNMWHPHGWKKFDGSVRSAHKDTGFRFPAPGLDALPPTSVGTVDSERGVDVDGKYKQWEDSWETEQLGKWSAGLKMGPRKEEGVWSRLAMAWKSKRMDMWMGMLEDENEVEMKLLESTSTTLATKLGRMFGLA